MKYRRLISLLLVALMLFSFIGCSSNRTATDEAQNAEKQESGEEENIDADGTFEIKYVFEIENGNNAQEGNHIDLCLYDNNDIEIYNGTLFKNDSTEELFEQFENVVTEEMVSSFIDEHFEATLNVWDEEKIPEDIYTMDEYPQNINVNLGNANFSMNIEVEECYLRALNVEAAHSDEFVYDYVLVLDDQYAQSLCGLCYKLTGTYDCDIDVSELELNGRTYENVAESDEPIAVEVSEPEPVPEPEEEINEDSFSHSYGLEFNDGMEGFTDKYIYKDDETWAYNLTHFVSKSGNEINFAWNGPVEIGECATESDDMLGLYNKATDSYLMTWSNVYSNDVYTEALNTSKETWTTYASGTGFEYTEDGFFDKKDGEQIRVTYQISGGGLEGFMLYLIDSTNEIYYVFVYVEKSEVFDYTRAIKVIESIEYKEYVPKQ